MIEAWHFTGPTLRDGRPIPADGEWLEHKGELELCASGLHASLQIIDALKYAPGNTICRVSCDGKILEASDKLVCTRRRIDWRIAGEDLLRDFARWCAWQVVDEWDAPDVARRWLATGDESIRHEAWKASRDATGGAARYAAWDAATAVYSAAAANDAAWNASRGEAWGAAWNNQNATLTAWVEVAHRGEYRKWTVEE